MTVLTIFCPLHDPWKSPALSKEGIRRALLSMVGLPTSSPAFLHLDFAVDSTLRTSSKVKLLIIQCKALNFVKDIGP